MIIKKVYFQPYSQPNINNAIDLLIQLGCSEISEEVESQEYYIYDDELEMEIPKTSITRLVQGVIITPEDKEKDMLKEMVALIRSQREKEHKENFVGKQITEEELLTKHSYNYKIFKELFSKYGLLDSKDKVIIEDHYLTERKHKWKHELL